ncbi:MAG: ThuA domain-containing protein, partial [Thermocrispum sp.]
MARRLSRRRHRRIVGVVGLGAVLVAATLLAPVAVAAGAPAPRAAAAEVAVLVFHGPVDQQQDPVARATEVITQLGQDNGIAVEATSDPAAFSAENLAQYRGVVFLSANGVTLDQGQESALQAYVKAGNGFLGVSDAAGAQSESEWFTGLIGARPAGEQPAGEHEAVVDVLD